MEEAEGQPIEIGDDDADELGDDLKSMLSKYMIKLCYDLWKVYMTRDVGVSTLIYACGGQAGRVAYSGSINTFRRVRVFCECKRGICGIQLSFIVYLVEKVVTRSKEIAP